MQIQSRRGAGALSALNVSWLALGLVFAFLLAPQASAQTAQNPFGTTKELPTVVGVEVNGLRSYSESTVLGALGVKVGGPVSKLRVRNAFETFGIEVRASEFKAAPGGVILVMEVSELEVDPEALFIGNEEFKLEKIREWAGMGERDQVYRHEAQRIANRVETGYRKQGFQFAEVSWALGEPDKDSVVRELIFSIHEGPKVRCIGLDIVGNDSLPETGYIFWKGGLRSLAKVHTKGRGPLSWFGRVFDEDQLQADLEAMRQVYRDRGWLDAKVEIDTLTYNEERNRVKVRVIVDEGALYRVKSVRVMAMDEVDGDHSEGELTFPEEDLLALCNLKEGSPLERARIQNDNAEIAFYYGDHGYLASESFALQGSGAPNGEGFRFLPPKYNFHVEEQLVDVIYRVVEGKPRTVREVKFRGNTHTRDHVLRREISVLPGELLSQRELERSRRRLSNSGYYADQSNPRHPQPVYRLEPVPGNPDLVDVVFEVEEGRNVDLRFTGGIDSNSGLVGIVSISMRNFAATALPSGIFSTFSEIYSKDAFHGNGETFSLNVSPGSEVDQFSADYAHPDAFGTHFDRTGFFMGASIRDRRFRSHDEKRDRLRLGLTHFFEQGDVSLRVGLVYQRLQNSDLDAPPLPSTLTGSPEESRFHGVNMELRISDLDNAQVPRSGSFMRLGTTFYGGPLGGDNDVMKTELRYDYYRQIGSNLEDVRSGIHVGLMAGVAAPYGDTDLVHYGERFFGGGSSHLRGFKFRGVGPYQGRYPLGGETMLGGTFEYRIPLYSTPIPGTAMRNEVFRLSLFSDWGIYDPDAWNLDPEELRATLGFSLGMLQPIPLAFNLGWPVSSSDRDETQVFSFQLSLR
ncbi:MAG: outer membrane protein assembly factor BamA [Planctomycetota bacterium]|nr:outer membrane protein assembly factor BamA [Planctomycetota bacterium]